MIIIESLQITALLFLISGAIKTDLNCGVIRNRDVFTFCAFFVVLDIIYYSIFTREYFVEFSVNLIGMFCLSIILYAYNIWAAGDSKFMIAIFLAIPGRIYSIIPSGIMPGFKFLIIVFSISYIYVMIESLVIGIKQKDLFKATCFRLDIKHFIRSFLAVINSINLLDYILVSVFSNFFESNSTFLMLINFIVILTIVNFSKLLCSWMYIAISGTVLFILMIIFKWQLNIISSNYWSYLFLVILIIIRRLSEKYNYKSIQTDEIKPGMILSYATVLNFSKSRIQGLPKSTFEDLRSRITEQEVESIKKWQKSKYCQNKIIIVRKIPFAIFMAIGTICFLLLEVFII